MGVSTYSSAMFNFVPRFALDFYADVRSGNREGVYRRMNQFVVPYLDIRDRGKGFGVSIVKAGMTAVGRHAGPVRPPIRDLSDADLADLTALIDSLEP
jgi:5-dehydro-4-deoxyglucarate dehydratase